MPSVKGGKPTLLAAGVKAEDVSPWLRWAVSPRAALTLLMVPPLLAVPTSLVLPFLPEALRPSSNPFTAFFLLSHPVPFPPPPSSALRATTAPASSAMTQLYTCPADLLLLAWTVFLFSASAPLGFRTIGVVAVRERCYPCALFRVLARARVAVPLAGGTLPQRRGLSRLTAREPTLITPPCTTCVRPRSSA
ncbi:hypothetical protein FB451DRAFT_1407502 [Mycena latifolia]|nr:hypothetical protein FB451DRAFT_1407502 [Mycena latifolia]